jgi:hypothetical protein
MREMFRNIFSSIAVFFSAVEKGSKTLENFATWAEQETAAFEAEAQVEREARLATLVQQLKVV